MNRSMSNTNAVPVRVVIADDEPTIVEALRQLLEEAGYIVVGTASDGASAIRVIEEHEPDAALIDLRMPDRSGIEVANELRERASSVPVIILSAYDDASLQVLAEKASIAAYLVKGCSSRQIFKALEEAVLAA